MALIKIKNEFIEVTINTSGAEIQSVLDYSGKEYIWQGDPSLWSGHSPVLFPICGGLNEDTYTLEGKKYNMEKHGFARNSEFEVTELSNSCTELLLKDSPETITSFPYRFEFRVRYTLCGKKLSVEFITKNLSDKTMYFSCGAHEGYNLPNGIDGTMIIFEKPEELYNYRVEGGVMSTLYDKIGDGTQNLILNKKYFEIDAIILKELSSRSLCLLSNDKKTCIRIDFPDFDHLLIWQPCGAPFVCIEPWTGLPDTYGSENRAIECKESITALLPNSRSTAKHDITFEF